MYRTAVVATVLLATVQAIDIGDRMNRTYTEYVPLPITVAEATAQGWEPVNTVCVPGLGYPFYLKTESYNTTILYFGKSGQVAGMSADVFGSAPPQRLVDAGYWIKVSEQQYRLYLAYRNPSEVCELVHSNHTIGDRIVINPMGVNRSLPLTLAAATKEGWFKGSCFYGMGTHWFFDLEGHPNMTWKAENLMPIVVMYNNDDVIHATFFSSWTVQQSLLHSVDWEPIPLPNALMCKNTCAADCTFAGTHFWSTYHVYYRDLALATCDGGCTSACCA
ncbi:hypothetical protein DIPPA_15705 [Diplonema papillatum]|nr:hypothetical protein DIPPA_15705 [Diplonema papillatum]|eukprot:gene15324-23424_t